MKLNTKIFLTISFIIFFLFIWGCSKNQTSPDNKILDKGFSQPDEKIEKINEQIFAEANISPSRSDYLLGPGDLIEVHVFEAEKLNTTARVSSSGEVSLPLLGEVYVEGLSAGEAEQFIENRFKESYIKDPHVSIFVKEHFSQRITVIGQVKNPGTYDYPAKQRLMDAIALAGGLTKNAGTDLRIRRLSSMKTGIPQTLMVNLDKLVNQGKTELNIFINGGDVIFVPEAGTFYIDGAVRRPGEYHLKNTQMTLEEAIFSAAGFASYAKTDNIKVMRLTESGEREEIVTNLENEEEINRIIIQDRDIIIVDSSFWGKVFHGGGVNIGIPGLGVSYRDPESRY